MRLSKAWIIAEKDFAIFRKKKSVIYSVVLFPLFVSIGLPLVIQSSGSKSGGIPTEVLPTLLNAFSFFFIIGAVTLPTAIASYSLVGEKIQKSIEPLLATPTTEGEILLGKSIAAFLPPIAAIYIGAIIFMIFTDVLTYSKLGYLYYPNWNMGVIMLLLVPLGSILSIEFDILISSRVNDVRAAQQLGGMVALPFAGIYVVGEASVISLDAMNLLIICAILVAIDVILFYVSKAVFRREEILTKWK
ncbi:MAG TPA: ABC transporter permease subunit [Nitrososphaera sp.]|jgi:ABC-type Na+ efflux pump permease subunit|nr:ABC transporter permease subunit [Nitrososphaera sp.]